MGNLTTSLLSWGNIPSTSEDTAVVLSTKEASISDPSSPTSNTKAYTPEASEKMATRTNDEEPAQDNLSEGGNIQSSTIAIAIENNSQNESTGTTSIHTTKISTATAKKNPASAVNEVEKEKDAGDNQNENNTKLTEIRDTLPMQDEETANEPFATATAIATGAPPVPELDSDPSPIAVSNIASSPSSPSSPQPAVKLATDSPPPTGETEMTAQSSELVTMTPPSPSVESTTTTIQRTEKLPSSTSITETKRASPSLVTGADPSPAVATSSAARDLPSNSAIETETAAPSPKPALVTTSAVDTQIHLATPTGTTANTTTITILDPPIAPVGIGQITSQSTPTKIPMPVPQTISVSARIPYGAVIDNAGAGVGTRGTALVQSQIPKNEPTLAAVPIPPPPSQAASLIVDDRKAGYDAFINAAVHVLYLKKKVGKSDPAIDLSEMIRRLYSASFKDVTMGMLIDEVKQKLTIYERQRHGDPNSVDDDDDKVKRVTLRVEKEIFMRCVFDYLKSRYDFVHRNDRSRDDDEDVRKSKKSKSTSTKTTARNTTSTNNNTKQQDQQLQQLKYQIPCNFSATVAEKFRRLGYDGVTRTILLERYTKELKGKKKRKSDKELSSASSPSPSPSSDTSTSSNGKKQKRPPMKHTNLGDQSAAAKMRREEPLAEATAETRNTATRAAPAVVTVASSGRKEKRNELSTRSNGKKQKRSSMKHLTLRYQAAAAKMRREEPLPPSAVATAETRTTTTRVAPVVATVAATERKRKRIEQSAIIESFRRTSDTELFSQVKDAIVDAFKAAKEEFDKDTKNTKTMTMKAKQFGEDQCNDIISSVENEYGVNIKFVTLPGFFVRRLTITRKKLKISTIKNDDKCHTKKTV